MRLKFKDVTDKFRYYEGTPLGHLQSRSNRCSQIRLFRPFFSPSYLGGSLCIIILLILTLYYLNQINKSIEIIGIGFSIIAFLGIILFGRKIIIYLLKLFIYTKSGNPYVYETITLIPVDMKLRDAGCFEAIAPVTVQYLSFGERVEEGTLRLIQESSWILYHMKSLSSWLFYLIRISGEFVVLNVIGLLFIIERYYCSELHENNLAVYISIFFFLITGMTVLNLLLHHHHLINLISELEAKYLYYSVIVEKFRMNEQLFINEFKRKINELDRSSLIIILAQAVIATVMVLYQILFKGK